MDITALQQSKEEGMHKLVSRAAVWALLAAGILAVPASLAGQPPPFSPRHFLSNLDLRCYTIPNQPPANLPLRLDHLNPVFLQFQPPLPPENVTLFEPQDLCVPVQKENNVVPPDVLPYIQFVDWKCYRIAGPSIDKPIHIDHLNPVIAAMIGPSDDIIVRDPQQLCVPVQKNNSVPPSNVLHLIQWLDVKCYRVDPNRLIKLTHLNPLLTTLPPEKANLDATIPLQLCVPVEKNQTPPPSDVLPFIQFADFLCYDLDGLPLNLRFNLTHQNPVLAGLLHPELNVLVTDSDKLCVPVAKNGMFPPGSP
jgi:hypothetical protein